VLQFLRYYARMRWWRLRTWSRFAFSEREREAWRQCFAIEPCLFNARHHGDYTSMAGFYNDTIPCGYMTPEDARWIVTGERQ
jgi:hypothetical protein